ncbi:NUMOD4 domain-containing protein [Hymenobacter psychrotolerans]|uniref:NUMOD4 motif-containing protein n=1 Tax=Hymenobacter psychrotolerans DSM 18569 TaxID=1121959 RepID=A0A1M7D8B1_9BACT|nr:NUMOD4 domain-containing protein [Hymenobacter psychrotolerans]SHL75771.1 NUMOD4 motif-containing protein [Hymenobacter psychrotolerans DSM 18569]
MYPYQHVGAADLPGEEWRAVAGFDYYEVSSLGRVRSVDRFVVDRMGRTLPKAGRILKQKQTFKKNDTTGVPSVSLQVSLYPDAKPRYMNVRRLVYAAFVNAQLVQELVVMNRDSDGYNNCVENLLPGTKSEWARRVDTRGRRTSALSYVDRSKWPKNSGGYQKQRAVGQYDAAGKLLNHYVSIAEAARQTNSDLSSISRTVRGLKKHYRGYSWRYMK